MKQNSGMSFKFISKERDGSTDGNKFVSNTGLDNYVHEKGGFL